MIGFLSTVAAFFLPAVVAGALITTGFPAGAALGFGGADFLGGTLLLDAAVEAAPTGAGGGFLGAVVCLDGPAPVVLLAPAAGDILFKVV